MLLHRDLINGILKTKMAQLEESHSGLIVYHADWNLMWCFSVDFQEILQFSEINFSQRCNKSCDLNPFSLESFFPFCQSARSGESKNKSRTRASKRTSERAMTNINLSSLQPSDQLLNIFNLLMSIAFVASNRLARHESPRSEAYKILIIPKNVVRNLLLNWFIPSRGKFI